MCVTVKVHCRFEFQIGNSNINTYSSVPNRRVGQNKRAGGKILRKHKRAGRNRRAGRKFSGKSINVQSGNFL